VVLEFFQRYKASVNISASGFNVLALWTRHGLLIPISNRYCNF